MSAHSCPATTPDSPRPASTTGSAKPGLDTLAPSDGSVAHFICQRSAGSSTRPTQSSRCNRAYGRRNGSGGVAQPGDLRRAARVLRGTVGCAYPSTGLGLFGGLSLYSSNLVEEVFSEV